MNSSKASIAIICCETDPASMNIRKQLLELYPFEKQEIVFEDNPVFRLEKDNYSINLYTITKHSVYFDEVNNLDEQYIIFPSEHQSEKKVPSLTVHSTGIWNEDTSFGGKPRTLSIAWPAFLKEAFLILNEKVEQNHLKEILVTPEVTHHGPYVDKPHAYIEIGSTEEQWHNEAYGIIIAETIIETLNKIFSEDYEFNYKVAVGIGGPHYCNNLVKVFLSKEYALSHVCPKYMNAFLDEDMILKALNASEPKAELVILDWKGIQDRQRILQMIEKLKLPYLKTKNIKF
ncbi:MAG: D-aminoacyl-tRNA deacylase [Candidatus Woesearchaeota archaeon]|nr:D-aminoacyl-tRNA deacylase [Candidatus Woesearchaeota archaeon]MDN5327547.1 D-aminoacyl-tRNA deacylase [Candidatus Woesearchaeota archaeon]